MATTVAFRALDAGVGGGSHVYGNTLYIPAEKVF